VIPIRASVSPSIVGCRLFVAYRIEISSHHFHFSERHRLCVTVLRKGNDKFRNRQVTGGSFVTKNHLVDHTLVPRDRVLVVAIEGHDTRAQFFEAIHRFEIREMLLCPFLDLFGKEQLDLKIPFHLNRQSGQHRSVEIPVRGEEPSHKITHGVNFLGMTTLSRLVALAGSCGHLDGLIVVQVRFDPPPNRSRFASVSKVQKPDASYIRAVDVIQEQLHLFFGTSQRQ